MAGWKPDVFDSLEDTLEQQQDKDKDDNIFDDQISSKTTTTQRSKIQFKVNSFTSYGWIWTNMNKYANLQNENLTKIWKLPFQVNRIAVNCNEGNIT